MASYSCSKAAVIGLTKSVGKEYAETGKSLASDRDYNYSPIGITVNALAPAVVKTTMVDSMPTEQVKYMTDKIPMKR